MTSIRQDVKWSVEMLIEGMKKHLTADAFSTQPCVRRGVLRRRIESLSIRGTQRIVSVNYLFGRPLIPSNFLTENCHLELS